MPEYIQYDSKGKITNKWYSVDEKTVVGKENILQVERDTFKTLTKFHKVDSGKVREMTQVEKDVLTAEEVSLKEQLESERIDSLNITTKELVNILINKGILKKDDVNETTCLHIS